MKSLDDQIKCVQREIAMRERVYPKLVESGRMRQSTADHELECMKDVLENLQRLRKVEQQCARPYDT